MWKVFFHIRSSPNTAATISSTNPMMITGGPPRVRRPISGAGSDQLPDLSQSTGVAPLWFPGFDTDQSVDVQARVDMVRQTPADTCRHGRTRQVSPSDPRMHHVGGSERGAESEEPQDLALVTWRARAARWR